MDHLTPLATLPPHPALRAAIPYLDRLVATDCERLLTHRPQPATRENQPQFTLLRTEAGLTLQLFLWPAGVWTPIHDHTSWGIYRCLSGLLIEDRYERLDEGAQPSQAHLRRAWRAAWRPGQQSTLLPYEGGIHRVGNPYDRQAVSVHLYGPPQAGIDGRDYDPSRDYVCDRPLDSLMPLAA